MLKLAPCLLAAAGGTPIPYYVPLELHEMMGLADVIVAGEITELGRKTFTLSVHHQAYPPGPELESISVAYFVDWMCAWRWTPYRKGQHVIVFGQAGDASEGPGYRILSGGGEGEMPIVNRESPQVVVRAGVPPACVTGEHSIRGHAATVRLGEMIRVSQAFRRCFRADYTDRWDVEFTRVGSSDDDAALEACGPLGAHLLREGRAQVPPDAVAQPRRPDPLIRTTLPKQHPRGALVVIGDVDDNGVLDWAGRYRGADAILVYMMSADGTVLRAERLDLRDLEGEVATADPRVESGLGQAIAPLGDLDGDGTLEIAVSAPYRPEGGEMRGCVYVFSIGSNATSGGRSSYWTQRKPTVGSRSKGESASSSEKA